MTERFPPLSPIRFVPYDVTESEVYHTRHFDNTSFKDSLKPGQLRTQYYQKMQFNDTSWIHFHSTTTTCQIQVRDTYGKILTSWTETHKTALSGFVNETGQQFYTYQAQLFPTAWSLPGGGVFHLHLKFTHPSSVIKEYISEPLYIWSEHKNTILIKYTNENNFKDVLFENVQPRPVFHIRVDSEGLTLQPAGEHTVFNDQGDELEVLHSNPYRNFSLDLGGKTGLPEWLIDKLNHVFSCSLFEIDRKQFKREEGAQLEQVGPESKPLQWRKMLLREHDHSAGYTFEGGAKVLVVPFNDGNYPYAYSVTTFTNGINTFNHSPVLHYSSGDEDILFNYYENVIAPAWGLEGTFTQDSDGIWYQNAEGERYYSARSAILTKVAKLYLTTINSLSWIRFWLLGAVGGEVVIDFSNGGDVAMSLKPYQSNLNTSVPAQNPTLVERTFAAGDHGIWIFHNDSIAGFYFNHSSTESEALRGLDGTFGTRIAIFNIANRKAKFDSTVDIDSLLAGSNTRLKELVIQRASLQGLDTGAFTGPHPSLVTVDLSINTMDSAAVDDVFNMLVTNTGMATFPPYLPTAGTINTAKQSPKAPPTSASNTARNGHLVWWTKITD